MAIADYSTDPSSNVLINGINIAELCPAANLNNAIRQMMADIKVFYTTQATALAGFALLNGTSIFSGPIKRDVQFNLDMAGANPAVSFDAGDGITYDRAANKFLFKVAGVTVASIDGSGNLILKGNVTASSTP